MSDEIRVQGGLRVLVMAASLVLIVGGLQSAAPLLVPFLTALFIATLSLPLLALLQRSRLPNGLAVLLTILAVLGVIVGIGMLVSGSLQEFTAAAPRYQAKLKALAAAVIRWIETQGVPAGQWYTDQALDPGIAIDVINGTLRAAAAVLSNTVLVLITTIFILLEAAGFPEKLRAALGGSDVELSRFASIKREIQHYLAIKTLISLITGSLVAIGLALLDVDYPLLWGLIAFLLNYIPTLGSILATFPPALLALVQHGPGRALVVVLGFAIVNIALGSLLEPQLMGRKLGLSPLIVFLSLVFWGWVWGPVGMLLSVPLTMIVKIMLENSEDLRWIAILLDSKAPRGA